MILNTQIELTTASMDGHNLRFIHNADVGDFPYITPSINKITISLLSPTQPVRLYYLKLVVN